MVSLFYINLFFPLIGAFVCFLVPGSYYSVVRVLLLLISTFSLFWMLFIWTYLDCMFGGLQFYRIFPVIESLGFYLSFGLDRLSFFFICLTSLIFPFCFLSAWNNTEKLFFFLGCLSFLEFFVFGAFYAYDFISFFIFLESTLLPMFLIIGSWGSGPESVRAAYLFFFFTAVGSIFFLIGSITLFINLGSFGFLSFSFHNLSVDLQRFLFFCFGLSFAVNVPLFPLHTWLPEAHVQAPTEGSVILASILLKLGGYGILSVLLSGLPDCFTFFSPLVLTVCFCGIFFCSLSAVVQTDLNNILAYSSVAHMNLAVSGLFSLNFIGINGSLFLMFSHGIVSSIMLFLVGFLYDSHHTRNIIYFGGLVEVMPLFSFFFFIATIANAALPGTCGFIGEILVLIGLFDHSPVYTIGTVLVLTLSVCFSFFLFNRLVFLNLNTNFISVYNDLTSLEAHTVGLLVFLVIFLGIWPGPVLDFLEITVSFILSNNI